MLKITTAAMRVMVEHCEREYPNEACGYLAGTGDTIAKTFPIVNAAASPTWYEMDPSEQLKAQKEIRAQKLEHLAVYHSHVATEAYPSPRDIERATAIQDFYGGYYLLVTLKDQGRPRARAFAIQDRNVTEQSLEEV
jgi:proteasome lid subunit RPN8/RPN11